MLEKWYKIKYQLLEFFSYFYRIFKYKNTVILDTGLVVQEVGKEDNRVKKLPFHLIRKKKLVTEMVLKEIEQKLLTSRFVKRINEDFEVISFNKLYDWVHICPVYYNFISAMYNPATINSDLFNLHQIYSIKSRRDLSQQEEKLHMQVSGSFKERISDYKSIIGNKKTEIEQVMDKAASTILNKRKTIYKKNDMNFLNDIRSMALVFIYALLKEENVTFVTGDIDAVSYFFEWTSGMCQQNVFNVKCLKAMREDGTLDNNPLLPGPKNTYYFPIKEVINDIRSSNLSLYSNQGKYFKPRLTIKYWDKNRSKYFDFSINIDVSIRKLFMHSHGGLNCPSSKNDLMCCFFSYEYWWPPQDSKGFKITPRIKPLHHHSAPMDSTVHDECCLYRNKDKANDFSVFSWFSDRSSLL